MTAKGLRVRGRGEEGRRKGFGEEGKRKGLVVEGRRKGLVVEGRRKVGEEVGVGVISMVWVTRREVGTTLKSIMEFSFHQ